MAIIKKLVWLGFLDDLKSGKKKFDLRLNSFEVKEGDTIIFEEWNENTEQYTGRNLTVTVDYTIKTKDLVFWKQEDIDKLGYVVMSISRSRKTRFIEWIKSFWT